MAHLRHLAARLLVRAWPLLAAILVLVATPALLATTRNGRVAVEASIYLPDMIVRPPAPFRLVDLISDAPRRERVTIDYQSRNGPRSIEADLYTPASGGAHAGVVFSMGAPPLPLDDGRLVRIAEDAARSGVVMLVPFSERLDELRIEPEEVDALVAEFQYVQRQPGVDPGRIGFFGASIGGSLALVAAADPRIAADVDHVVSFGGYFDALTAFGAIATRRIVYDGVDEAWSPQAHAEQVMAYQLINRVDSVSDRALLERMFIDDEPATSEQLASLGPVGRSSYDFLANRDPADVQALADRLPPDAVADLDYLSPRTGIHRVKAELFIISDRGDPYIPYTESRMMRDALRTGGGPKAHFDELRLFDHVQPKLDQDPAIVVFDSTRLMFRLYQLLLRWD